MDKGVEVISFQEWSNFNQQLLKESDRGVALIGAEILNLLIEGLLKKKFLDDPNSIKKLTNGQGAPLSSLYSKTLLAYGMGLISNDEYNDLQIIRNVRNKFAHSFTELVFSNKRISTEIEKLVIPNLSNYSHTGNPRNIFINGVSMLATFVNLWIKKPFDKVEVPAKFVIVDTKYKEQRR